MLSININKLRSQVEERENKKNKLFEKILDLCYQRILNTNEKSDSYNCTYIVPNVVFGLPLYDVNECTKYIMDKLLEKGFEITFAYPTTIHISWMPDNKKAVKYDNYDKYGNYGSGSSNHYQFKALEAPQPTKFREKKPFSSQNSPPTKPPQKENPEKLKNLHDLQYKSIDDYLVSKPLIYDPEDINVFQNTLNNIFT